MLRLAGELGELSYSVTEQRRHFLESLSTILDAQVGILGDIEDFRPGGLGRAVGGIDRGWGTESERVRVLDLLSNKGANFDPLTAALMCAYRPGTTITYRRADVVTDKAWYASAYFCDYRRLGYLDDAIYSAGADRLTGLTRGLGMSRPQKSRRFTEEERDLLHLAHEEYGALIGRRIFARAKRPLSPREQDVLEALLTGQSEKGTAAILGLSPHTVHQYVTALYRAFDVQSRGELLFACLGHGKSPRPGGRDVAPRRGRSAS
ncbi:Transcriptional regulator, LuxR family protein [Minicystis rosea]|nr:Transcriptional regulator, LuxR family protein [Minicystis rosea]